MTGKLYDPLNRFTDLNRQGFMRAVYAPAKKPKVEKPIVACDKCKNWHRKGQHIKPRCE